MLGIGTALISCNYHVNGGPYKEYVGVNVCVVTVCVSVCVLRNVKCDISFTQNEGIKVLLIKTLLHLPI